VYFFEAEFIKRGDEILDCFKILMMKGGKTMNMYVIAHWIIAASSLGTVAITAFNAIRKSKPPPSVPLENDGLEAEEEIQA